MKATYPYLSGALVPTFAIAACIPSAEPPAPSPTPVAAPAPAPTPTPTPMPAPVIDEPVFENYLDAPQTAGTWTFVVDRQGPRAVYGTNANRPDFIVRCTGPKVALARRATQQVTGERTMSITTETTTRDLALMLVPSASPSDTLLAVGLEPNDPLLDAMAITKGRIAIGVEGERTLYLPAWAEISRVIEDCR